MYLERLLCHKKVSTLYGRPNVRAKDASTADVEKDTNSLWRLQTVYFIRAQPRLLKSQNVNLPHDIPVVGFAVIYTLIVIDANDTS